jgi:hypothetical protein
MAPLRVRLCSAQRTPPPSKLSQLRWAQRTEASETGKLSKLGILSHGLCGCRSGLVALAATPTKPDLGIENRETVHPLDGVLGILLAHVLHETTSFARRNLDISNLAEMLEIPTQCSF